MTNVDLNHTYSTDKNYLVADGVSASVHHILDHISGSPSIIMQSCRPNLNTVKTYKTRSRNEKWSWHANSATVNTEMSGIIEQILHLDELTHCNDDSWCGFYHVLWNRRITIEWDCPDQITTLQYFKSWQCPKFTATINTNTEKQRTMQLMMIWIFSKHD